MLLAVINEGYINPRGSEGSLKKARLEPRANERLFVVVAACRNNSRIIIEMTNSTPTTLSCTTTGGGGNSGCRTAKG